MACHLVNNNTSSEPMLACHWLDGALGTHLIEILMEMQQFSFKEIDFENV